MTKDMQARIDAKDARSVVFVDHFDDNEMWISIQVPGGGANCVLTFEQAKEMIAAMSRVIEQS